MHLSARGEIVYPAAALVVLLAPPAGGGGGGGARQQRFYRKHNSAVLCVAPVAAGDLAAARALAAAGWQAAHAVDKHGNTALMWAAGSGRLAAVRWLLEEEGVAVRPAC